MSFKRDGDDRCALDNQRKRRVADLLYEGIEEDEVMRLSNGKYKCKLCSHQPIFDTLNMFYVHKQGKKHQYSLEYADQQKQELADLIEKRKHEQFIQVKQAEGDAVTMETVSKSTLGIKKPRKLHDRKLIIDYASSSNTEKSTFSIEATSATRLPGNRLDSAPAIKTQKPLYESVRKSSYGDKDKSYSTQGKQLARDTNKGTRMFNMQYKNQLVPGQCSDNAVISARDVHKLVGQSNAELNNKYYLSRKKQLSETSNLVSNLSTGLNDNSLEPSTKAPSQTWEFYKDFKGKVPFKMKSSDKLAGKVSSSFEECKDIQRRENIVTKSDDTKEDTCVNSREKKERAAKFLNAFGSGWKRDWTGSWVKDEDAEFDSDEEPPDIS